MVIVLVVLGVLLVWGIGMYLTGDSKSNTVGSNLYVTFPFWAATLAVLASEWEKVLAFLTSVALLAVILASLVLLFWGMYKLGIDKEPFILLKKFYGSDTAKDRAELKKIQDFHRGVF